MFMPKKNRVAIYSYLFKEGVIVVHKDTTAAKHHNLDVPNIHAMDAMKSLASRGFVRVTFNWCVAAARMREGWGRRRCAAAAAVAGAVRVPAYCGCMVVRVPHSPPAAAAPPRQPAARRQWLYYYLTDEGVAYLRQYLHLSEETVPATHKRPAPKAGLPEGRGEGRFDGARARGPRKDGDAPREFRPRFGGEGGYRAKEASA